MRVIASAIAAVVLLSCVKVERFAGASKAASFPPGSGADAHCFVVDDTSEKALDCLRKIRNDALPATSTKIADMAFVGCVRSAAEPITIGAHGSPGYVMTGDGKAPANPKRYIGFAAMDQTIWKADLKDTPVTASQTNGMLTLLACHTGADTEGATLLHELAQHLQRPVRGRTDFIYCKGNTLTYEGGENDWQTALPGEAQAPAAKPIFTRAIHTPSRRIVISGETYDVSQLLAVQVKSVSGHKISAWVSLETDVLPAVPGLAEFDQPRSLGTPLAVETARIRLLIDTLGPREFIVWNDRLLQDAVDTDNVYYGSPALPALLALKLQ
jgi:hypothetical protein